ncbi:hypothetical protein F5X96DRAFT_647913 [Biscogniauxia mediterranea]|nr:hypothetical protein F5X96DRAFT_647913 [Biscogniauxia mediterranea]
MPEFEFVNVGRPDDVKRHSTKIRRHVMKDIGKARRRPKKRGGQTTIDESDLAATAGAAGEEAEAEAEEPHDLAAAAAATASLALAANPNVDGSLSAMVYPTEMDEERLNLARYMFAEARANYRPFRFPWMSMGLSDPAAWHITMANAVLFRGMRPGSAKPDYNSSLEAMKWYTRSLESITRRLADPAESGGEGLIVAVAGFICHDSSTGNFTRQEVHMKGLKRLVEDRGGLEELNSPFLRLMISWHDLLGASYRNSAPLFGVPRGSITEIDAGADTEYLEGLLETWGRRCGSLGDIASAMRATAAVASYINRRCGGDANFWRDEVKAARLLAPALHEVLSLEGRPLPDRPGDEDVGYSATAAREAFRRAALLFLASVKVRFGAAAYEIARHLDAFRQISQLPGVDWAFVPELNLWAQVTCALHETGADRAWNVVIVVGIMDALGLGTSAQALGLVRRIMWVDALGEGGKLDSLCREIDALVASNGVRGAQGAMNLPPDTHHSQAFAGES